MLTLEQAIMVLDEALGTTALRPAWLIVRSAARRNRRLRETLPRVFALGQHVTLALELLDALFLVITPSAYETARQLRDHLVAMRDALRTGREDEETQPFTRED